MGGYWSTFVLEPLSPIDFAVGTNERACNEIPPLGSRHPHLCPKCPLAPRCRRRSCMWVVEPAGLQHSRN
jgi:hypothetical protein